MERISECSDAELIEIIIAGYKRSTGKNGGALTAQELTDEKLVEIIMKGR